MSMGNDQAERLRQLFDAAGRRRARCLAIASGKGGVGKSTVAVNLAILLARRGQRVLLLDADLGLANIDVMFGLLPVRTLEHVVTGEVSLGEILMQAGPGVTLLPGASGLCELADLRSEQCDCLLADFIRLQNEFDWLIIDSAPGIAANGVAFAAAADEVLLVTAPEPTAIADAYAFLKVLLTRRREGAKGRESMLDVGLLVNMVTSAQQGAQWGAHLQRVAAQFQQWSVAYLGCLPFDGQVGDAVRHQQPVVQRAPRAAITHALRGIADRMTESRMPSRAPTHMRLLEVRESVRYSAPTT